jgi:hypothetical protein
MQDETTRPTRPKKPTPSGLSTFSLFAIVFLLRNDEANRTSMIVYIVHTMCANKFHLSNIWMIIRQEKGLPDMSGRPFSTRRELLT